MARTFYSASSTGDSTSTDTVNYTNKVSVPFTATSGSKYAIFWSATGITNSTTEQSVRVRLQNTTNATTLQQYLQTPELATSVENFSFADVSGFTTASTGPVTMSVQFSPSAGTMTIRDTFMTVLQLEAGEDYSSTDADSANITTANWGTSRTLTVGGTGKAVDGSAAVSWSIAEILTSSVSGNADFGTASVRSGAVAVAASDINCGGGNYFTKTATAALTWTFSSVPTTRVYSFILQLTAGGAYTMTWPASVQWDNATAPALSNGGTDLLAFITVDSGTTWRGIHVYKP